jgi:hypothetical protein
MTSDHIIATMTLDFTAAFYATVIEVHSYSEPWLSMKQPLTSPPRCGVKNAFGMSENSKEYTFPLLEIART